jgi:hypothetical protein
VHGGEGEEYKEVKEVTETFFKTEDQGGKEDKGGRFLKLIVGSVTFFVDTSFHHCICQSINVPLPGL